MGRFQDLTGNVYGRLTVLERAENKVSSAGNAKTMWKCQCECGNITIVNASQLKSGHTQSCGCYHKEQLRKIGDRCRQYNEYEFNGDFVTGYTRKGEPFYIDAEDYDLVKDYCWSVNANGYLHARGRNGLLILLHRLVTGVEPDMLIDHINHGRMDNRKSNLRKVKDRENRMNHKMRSNNTSGYVGVARAVDRNGWIARIGESGNKHYLGRFDSFDDAVAARKAAEERYFGPYSYDNSIAAVPRIDAHADQNLRDVG